MKSFAIIFILFHFLTGFPFPVRQAEIGNPGADMRVRGMLALDSVLKDPVDLPLTVRDSFRYREKVMRVRKNLAEDTLRLPRLYPLPSVSGLNMVYLPDSLIRDSLIYEYTRIKDFAYRRRFTKELYRMIFVNPKKGRMNVMMTQNSEARFKPFEGKRIADIDVKVLEPYGTSVYDTSYVDDEMGWLKDLANKTHMSTAEGVILRQLTVRPGMPVRAFELVQNEVLLRNLDYIDEALFMIRLQPGDTNSVHVTVVCKDELSWGGSVESNFINSFKLGVDNKNFLKLGHVVKYEISFRESKEKQWGNELEYRVNSLWGTHIDIRGYYRNDYRMKEVSVDVERSFLTDRMRWAGGIDVGRVFYSEELPDRNITRLDSLFNYHYQDVWAGRSFYLPARYGYNQSLFVTSRFFTTIFNNRPRTSDDTNHLYHNRRDYFSALTYRKMKYYKANLIYDFGRTEDIPTGLMLQTTVGYEKSEYEDFGYLGAEGIYSYFNPHNERFYSVDLALDSYIGENGFERGQFKVRGNHISNLVNVGNVKFRFYNELRYTLGIRRYPGDFLYMDDWNIKGFSSDTLRGNQKLSLSLGTTFFMPRIRKGFRMSLSNHVDYGVLAAEGKSLFRSKSYWGIGIGINLRNNNVAIKNLSLRLTFFPTITPDGRAVQYLMTSSRRGRFNDYRVRKPQVIQYD